MRKTMKRSLALGALMAFVITGSAMATTTQYGVNATESDVNANDLYPEGIIEDVNYGIKASSHTVEFSVKDIEINSKIAGSYTVKGGKIILGGENTENITISVESNDNSYAIQNGSGSNGYTSLKANNIILTNKSTGSDRACGIYQASASGLVNILGNQIIIDSKTAMGTSYAIYNKGNDGKVTLGGEGTEKININASGKTAYGVTASAKNSQNNIVARNVLIETHATETSYGIQVEAKNSVNSIKADEKVEINTISDSGNSLAINTQWGSNLIDSDIIKLYSQTTGSKDTAKAYGVFSQSNGSVKLTGNQTDIDVVNKGKGEAYGVNVKATAERKDATVDIITDNIKISSRADEGSLAVASFVEGEGTLNIGTEFSDNVILNANSKNGTACALLTQESATDLIDGGSVNVYGKNIKMVIDGKSARGISNASGAKMNIGNDGSNVNIKATGVKDAVGIASFEHGTTTVNGDSLVIEVEASDENGTASGIHAQNNGKGGELATINVNSINTVIKAKDAITAYSEGVVNVNGNIYIEGKNAVVARGDAQVNINTEGKNNIVQMNGDVVFNVTNDGQSGLDADAKVNIKLTNADSYLKGNVIKTQSGPSEGVDMTVDGMELEVADGGTWSADADSFVNNLKMDKGGIVELAGKNQKLSIDNLIADSDIVKTNDVTNQMVVSKDANAKNVTVNGSGAIADQIAADGATANKLAGVVVGKDGNTLANKVTTDEGVIGGRFEGVVDEKGNVTGSQGKNTTNTAISEMGSIALMAWRQENNDMNKRLGELRNSKGEHGIWTRMTRGESEFKSVKNQYNAYQIGYDEKLSKDKTWTVGAVLTYTDAQSSFAGGSGENTHKGFAIYGSKLNEDGSFIDLIAKYARLEHEFDTVGGIGSGEYDTNGYSVSAEYGKRFEKGNGFWVEPQVELTYGKVGSVNYATDKAMAYQDGMESLVGRVGFSLGKDIKDGNVYVRASYLYDFDGETQVTMTNGTASDTYEQDLGGGWFEVGVGTNINLSDATYVYLDVEKTYGGDVATPWQWNAGVRYSF